jgi:threonine synthase
VAAARRERRRPQLPRVTLATAHPAKFPDAVAAAIGRRPALPDRLARLLELDERFETLPNDYAALSSFILEHARLGRVTA